MSRLFLLAVVLASPALARDAKPEARAAWTDGLHLYDAGDYPGALARFQQAYAIEPAPLLLFNIAQAYRLQKDDANALATYREYLRAVPAAPNRADVLVLLEEVNSRLQASESLRRDREEPDSPREPPPQPQPLRQQPIPQPPAPISQPLPSASASTPRASRRALIRRARLRGSSPARNADPPRIRG